MFKALLEDIENSRSKAEIVKNFHDAFVLAIATAAQICNQIYGIKEVALSGGVFMNRYLLERTSSVLMQAGFTVAVNKDVPPNDGGVSLGQVFVG